MLLYDCMIEVMYVDMVDVVKLFCYDELCLMLLVDILGGGCEVFVKVNVE